MFLGIGKIKRGVWYDAGVSEKMLGDKVESALVGMTCNWLRAISKFMFVEGSEECSDAIESIALSREHHFGRRRAPDMRQGVVPIACVECPVLLAVFRNLGLGLTIDSPREYLLQHGIQVG